MKSISFQIPNKIEIGYSRSKELPVYLKNMGLKKVLLVVDNGVRAIGLIDQIMSNLEDYGILIAIFDDIKNEPTVDEIDRVIGELNVGENYDGIIGIGGGSTIDMAKLLAVSMQIEESIINYVGTGKIKNPGLPMIMLPTTSGTGAEATPNAIVKDEKAQCKKVVVSTYLLPDLVILDPELTISLPAKITAETGIDAFTHAIECFICNKSDLMSDMYSLEAMKLISKYIRTAVRDGKNKEARYYMALGSFFAGIAIANSGTGGVHALAYPLGGKYGISHGLSNSILLADVIEFNAEAVPEKFIKVADVMGIRTTNFSREKVVKSVVDEIRKLVNNVGITIEGFEVSEKLLDNLATLAISEQQRLLKNNPRPISYEDARQIYRKVLLNKKI